MSCGCHSNPCQCEPECDAENEPLASALNNFITSFYGSVSKSCVNDEVVWQLPCDLEAGLPDFPRLPGEGIACYLLRVTNAGCCCFIPRNTIIVDNTCYTTFQEAYDAADSWQQSLGNPSRVTMYVGGTDFISPLGNLRLTKKWNNNVRIFGVGNNLSSLGSIDASNSEEGFEVNISCGKITLGDISTMTTDTTGTFNGGRLQIRAFGSVVVDNINTSAPTGNHGGDVILINNGFRTLNINTAGQKQGGDITIGRNGAGLNNATIDNNRTYGSYGANVLDIDARSLVSGRSGRINLGESVGVRSIDFRAMVAGSGGHLIIRKGSRVDGPIFRGTQNPGLIQLDGCYVFDQIDTIGENCNFKDVTFQTLELNKSNIQEVTANGALFTGCFFMTDGTGVPIASSTPKTIISYFTLSQKALDPDVTVSEGTFTVTPNLRFDNR